MVKTYAQLQEEIRNGGIAHDPSFAKDWTMRNANGAIDSSTLGVQYAIQTTTLIRTRVVEQVFYKIAPAEYMPVVVGEGAYMENIETNIEYQSAGDFESGYQSTAEETRITNVDANIAPINAVIKTWVGGYQYTDLAVEKALRSNNWNPIEAKMRANKERWDLGIQKIAFLGSYSDSRVPGLLTNSGVTVNTSVITQNISTMSPTQFASFVGTIMGAYFLNSNDTVLPDTFEIPYQDWLGLTAPISPTFPTVSMMTYLKEAFAAATGNPNFKIYPCAYGDKANNTAFNNTNRYCLYRNNEETMRMDIPLPFVLRAPMSPDNFRWNGVALGQHTGLVIYRVPEVLYFDHS
jgi:hypothetical protein